MYWAAWTIASFKWRLLLPQHSWYQLLKINFIGQYYSMVFPGQIAGEIVKAYRLGRGQQDPEQIAASVVIDKITGLLGLLFIALGGIVLSRSKIEPAIAHTLVAGCAMLLVGLFCLKVPTWSRLVDAVLSRFGRVGSQLVRLLHSWRRYLEQPQVLLLSMLLGACFQLLAVAINVLFARELGVVIGFADWCWLFGLISLVTMLPFTIGGIGLREGSFVGGLALFGVPAEQALAISFAIFSLLLSGSLLGAVFEWTGSASCRSNPAAE